MKTSKEVHSDHVVQDDKHLNSIALDAKSLIWNYLSELGYKWPSGQIYAECRALSYHNLPSQYQNVPIILILL